jgi:hypothetical protein
VRRLFGDSSTSFSTARSSHSKPFCPGKYRRRPVNFFLSTVRKYSNVAAENAESYPPPHALQSVVATTLANGTQFGTNFRLADGTPVQTSN